MFPTFLPHITGLVTSMHRRCSMVAAIARPKTMMATVIMTAAITMTEMDVAVEGVLTLRPTSTTATTMTVAAVAVIVTMTALMVPRRVATIV